MDFREFMNPDFQRYEIPFGNKYNYDDAVKACYAFLQLKSLYKTEFAVFNSHPSVPTGGYMMPKDTFIACYTGDSIPSFGEFKQIICEHGLGGSGMAAFDKNDSRRIGLMLVPKKMPGFPLAAANVPCLMITVYEKKTPELNKVIDEWELLYEKL